MTNGLDRLAPSAGTLVLVDEAARATSGDSGAITGLGAVPAPLKVQLHVTEVSSVDFTRREETPTLTVVIEETPDGTNWNEIGKFRAMTAVGSDSISLSDPLAETIRVRWTITGISPSVFRFSITSPACWSDA